MRPVEPLDEVADAILDGTPVDWDRLDSAEGATDQELIEQLKTLAAVKLARQAAESETPRAAYVMGSSSGARADRARRIRRSVSCLGQSAGP